MNLGYIYKLLTGKMPVKKKPKISFKNILGVFQFLKRSKLKNKNFINEQIIWRRVEVIKNEPECWESGHCIVCGCEILGKTMEDRGCSAIEVGEKQCYPDMMNKNEWEKYKLDNNINLFKYVNS